MKKALLWTLLVFVIPIPLSILYRMLPLGSIGPVVFFYSLGCIPFLTWIYSRWLGAGRRGFLSGFISVILAFAVSAFVLNYFTFVLTPLFGIHDFKP